MVSARIRKKIDLRPLRLFFEDEGRFGRISNIGKCWVPKEERALVAKQIVREYIYAFTALCPETGDSYSIISPVCNREATNILLDGLSVAYSEYRILLVMDGASWHTTSKLKIPENIEILALPPYSPELNPVEHIWDYIREQKGFMNRKFDSLDDVENYLISALTELQNEKEKVTSMCKFNWLPC